MLLKKVLLVVACMAVLLSASGCVAVSVATTAVGVGVAAGSLAIGAATTVAKGAVSVGSAVIGGGDDEDEDD